MDEQEKAIFNQVWSAEEVTRLELLTEDNVWREARADVNLINEAYEHDKSEFHLNMAAGTLNTDWSGRDAWFRSTEILHYMIEMAAHIQILPMVSC